MPLFGPYNLPGASRSRIVVPARRRQVPEERRVWGGCASSGSRGNSSENGAREEYGGKVSVMMDMPLHWIVIVKGGT
jgi:hypothetical protein